MIENEHETTYIIDQTGWTKLAGLPNSGMRQHDTVYYDDNEILLNAGATLRARFLVDLGGDRAWLGKLTLKINKERTEAGVRHAIEIHAPCGREMLPSVINVDEAFLQPEFSKHLAELGAERLRIVGCTRSVRRRVMLQHGEVDLDTVLQPDGSALLEVEIDECDAERHSRMAAELRELLGDAAELSISSKHERFRKAAKIAQQ
jgi:hypothetical protein